MGADFATSFFITDANIGMELHMIEMSVSIVLVTSQDCNVFCGCGDLHADVHRHGVPKITIEELFDAIH